MGSMVAEVLGWVEKGKRVGFVTNYLHVTSGVCPSVDEGTYFLLGV